MVEYSDRDSHRAVKRDLLDRLLVRSPAIARLLGKSLLHVRIGSQLRRRGVRLQVARGFAAMARSDVEVVELYYEPNVEVWMNGMVGAGLQSCYRGHEGIRALYMDLDEAWGDWSWRVRAIADGGDRLAVRTDFIGYGRASGIKITMDDGGTAVGLSPQGLVAWQAWFIEQGGWAKALEAVCLSE